jgi:protoporphyrinogen oxidase
MYAMSVLVVGAGLAGITSAVLLNQEGVDVMVVEKTPHLGGALRTLSYKDEHEETYRFDLGPHIPSSDVFQDPLFKNQEMIRVQSPIRSHLQLPQFDLMFPISMNQLDLSKLSFFSRYFPSYLSSQLRKKREITLEDYLINSYGTAFYTDSIKNYTKKFWVTSPKYLSKDADFARRVQPPKLREVLKGLLFPSKNIKKDGEKRTYPKMGIEQCLHPLITHLTKNGVTIKKSATVKQILNSQNKIQVPIEDATEQQQLTFDKILWTASIVDLMHLLRISQYHQFTYRYLFILYYSIFRENLLKKSVVASKIMIPKITFHRVYEPKKLSPFMTPPSTTSACLEVTLSKIEPHQLPSLINQCTAQFRELFSLADTETTLLGSYILPNAYPLLFLGYQPSLAQFQTLLLKTFPNIHLVGRTGQYRYWTMNQTLDAARTVSNYMLH